MRAPDKIWAVVGYCNGIEIRGEFSTDAFISLPCAATEYTRSDLIPNAAYVAGLEAALKPFAEVADARKRKDILGGFCFKQDRLLAARTALSARPDAPDRRVVTVAQLERWYGKMGNWTCQDELRTIIGEGKE